MKNEKKLLGANIERHEQTFLQDASILPCLLTHITLLSWAMVAYHESMYAHHT